MGSFFSHIFDGFLDLTNLSWPVKFVVSLVAFLVLVAIFGDYW